MVRLVKGGPRVPARIFRCCCCTIVGGEFNDPHDWSAETCDRSGVLSAEVAGKQVDLDRVWYYGTVIDEPEYRYQMDHLDWSRKTGANVPEASPERAVRLDRSAPLF